MGGFAFGYSVVTVEIEGVEYSFDPSDSAVYDAMVSTLAELEGLNAASGDGHDFENISDKLRDAIGAVLGREQAAQVFAGRPKNFVEETRLLLYLQRAMDESGATDSLSTLVQEFAELADAEQDE